MRNLKKVLSLLILLLFLSVSAVITTKVVQADTNLIKVEANISYNTNSSHSGKSLFLYKSKTFILEPSEFIVKEGNTNSVIIPQSELGTENIIQSQESFTKIYLFTRNENVYIVDKETNVYEKQSKDAFLQAFNTITKAKYPNFSVYRYFFSDEGLAWVSGFDGTTYQPLLIYKNGLIKSLRYLQTSTSSIDKNGNLYGFDSGTNELVKISTDGTETRYAMPILLDYDPEYGYGYDYNWFIDSEDRIYMKNSKYEFCILEIVNGKLQLLRTLDKTYSLFLLSSNRQVGYVKEIKGFDDYKTDYTLGFIDNSLNLNDKYFLHDSYISSVYDENNFLTIDNFNCHYGTVIDGKLSSPGLKGWQQLHDKRYYYDNNGIMKTGWLNDQGKWYYFNQDGSMSKGFVHLNDGTSYFFNNDGTMATGWFTTHNDWYYSNQSGSLQSGWLLYGGKWYFMRESRAIGTSYGDMLRGWIKTGNAWYYMDKNGAMTTGWIYDSSNWYYLYPNGQMAKNTTIAGYKLNANGAWIK